MTAAAAAGRARLARSLPFALYIAFLALEPYLASTLPWLDSSWLYGLRIAAALGALIFFRHAYDELFSAPAISPRDWIAALLLGLAVFLVWIGLDSGWTVIGKLESGFVPLAEDGALQWPLIVLRILGAAAVVPVMEELFWRSFIQRWIDRHDFLTLLPGAGSFRALAFASMAFGFEHKQWLAGIIAGLVYGVIYRRSGSLLPPIVAHGLTNLLLGIWVVSTGQWQFW